MVIPRLVEAFFQGGRDVFVLGRQDPIQHLDDGDLGSDCVVKVAEFQADRAAAQDQHRFRLAGKGHGLLVGDDGLAVEVSARQRAGRAPVAITIDSAVTFSEPTSTWCGAVILATPNLDCTLYFRNRPSMPLFRLAGDGAAAPDDLAEIPGWLAAVAEARAMVLDQLDQVGVGEQGLGRDASPVQADAAELVALDAQHALLELGRADRRRVSGGPPPITAMSKS